MASIRRRGKVDVVLAVVVVLAAAWRTARACSLTSADWAYDGYLQGTVYVSEYLTFDTSGSYYRSLQTSFINNCGTSHYVSTGTFTTSGGQATLAQSNCALPDGPSCIGCPANVTTYSYYIDNFCGLLHVSSSDSDLSRVYYAVGKPLSAGAVAGIVIGVLAAVGIAGAGVYYYTIRSRRTGYWSISNIQSEPESKF